MRQEYLLYFLVEIIPYALGSAHFACTIVLLIRWAILRTARARDRVIRPDMHRYASITYPTSFKVLAIIVIGGYLLVIIPAIVGVFAWAIFEINPVIPVAVTALLGLCALIALARAPLSHKEVSATVDSRGLTIEYKDGEKKTIGVRGYKGWLGQTKKHGFRLVYEGEDGKDEYEYLPFLSERDAILVGNDLITLRDHGYIEPPRNNPNPVQAAAPVSIPVRTPEEIQKINEKLAYTTPINAGGKIDDQEKYRAYLEDVLKKIPFEKRCQINTLVLSGNKAEAMRECQRASGEGLKIASDLFGNYLTSSRTPLREDGSQYWYIIDQNGDGSIDELDKVFKHNPVAPVTMGFQTKFQFYNFDLGLSFRANIGNYVFNNVVSTRLQNVPIGQLARGGYYTNLPVDVFNTYYVDGYNRTIYDETGKTIIGSADPSITDRFLENASFLRCDNITLGYSFQKNKISGRAFCTVSNPFVITKYSGLDPEVGFGGVDNSIYPRSMTTVLGINLQF